METWQASWQAFLPGAVGALLHESTRWIGLRTARKLPFYARKLHYWLGTVLLVGAGGLLASFLGPTGAREALFIGVSAPALISRIGTAFPESLKLSSAPSTPTSLREWLRG